MDHQEHQGLKDCRDLLVPRVKLEITERRDHPVQQVSPERLVHLEPKEEMEDLEHQDLRDLRVIRDWRDYLEFLVSQGKMANREQEVHLDQKVKLESKACKAVGAQEVLLVPKDEKEILERLDSPEPLENRAFKESRANLGDQEKMGNREIQDQLEILVQGETLDLKDCQEMRVDQVRQVAKVILAFLVSKEIVAH